MKRINKESSSSTQQSMEMKRHTIDDNSFSSLSGEADGADFHGGSHNQWSFWRIGDSKLVVHESALDDGFIL